MKKLFKALALAFVAIATVSVFNSCEKDEEFECAVYNNDYRSFDTIESCFDPDFDSIPRVTVGDLSLRGDSIFADVTVWYVKPNSDKYFKLHYSQFICDYHSAGCCILQRSIDVKSFILRGDSIFCVSESHYTFLLRESFILDSLNTHYSKFKHYCPQSSKYNSPYYVASKFDEESFVQVVNNPFERWYNNYTNGDEFVFVYYTRSVYESQSITIYGGRICPKKLVSQSDKFAPLEIVNY